MLFSIGEIFFKPVLGPKFDHVTFVRNLTLLLFIAILLCRSVFSGNIGFRPEVMHQLLHHSTIPSFHHSIIPSIEIV
jgi:hypothetical protein